MMKPEQINITTTKDRVKELSHDEKKILKYWWLLPDRKYEFYELIEYFQLDSKAEIYLFDLVHGFIGNGWVERDDKLFRLRASGRLLISSNIPPRVKECYPIIRYFNSHLLLKENERYSEKAHYLPFIEFMLDSFSESHLELIKLSGNLAIVYGKLNNQAKSIEYHLHEIKMGERINYEHLDRSYHNTAEAYYNVRNFRKSLEYSLRFIQFKDSYHDKTTTDFQQLAYHYYNAAILYFDMLDFSKAKEYIDKVVELDQKILDEEHSDFIYDLKMQKRIYIAYNVSRHFYKYVNIYFVISVVMILSLLIYLLVF